MGVPLPIEYSSNEDIISSKLETIVQRLEEEGISRDCVKKIANASGLKDCSYGSLKYAWPIVGAIAGVAVGVGANYLCDEICAYYNTELIIRTLLNCTSFLLPCFYVFDSGLQCRREQDVNFYDKLQEEFPDDFVRT